MLELKDICFSVKEKGKVKEILKNVNLKIEDDKFFVILGQTALENLHLQK